MYCSTGDMFGGGAGLFGGGLGMENAHHPGEAAAASAAYGAGWGSALGPSMFDPTGMSTLMNAGLYGMPGNAATAAGSVDPAGLNPAAGPGYDHMAAMAAAAGLHHNAALPPEASGDAPFGPHLLHSTGSASATDAQEDAAAAADTGTPMDISGTRSLSRDNSGGRGQTTAAMGPRASVGKVQNVTTVNASSSIATSPTAGGVRPSGSTASGWQQSGHGSSSVHEQSIRSRAQLPPLQIPLDNSGSHDPGHQAAVAAAAAESTTPKSSAVRAGQVAGHGVMHPPPHSPHMLGHFGPLFHPISPGGRLHDEHTVDYICLPLCLLGTA